MYNNDSTNYTESCYPLIRDWTVPLSVMYIISILVILVFSFLEQRIKTSTRDHRCNRRPGLAIPINFIDDYSNRWKNAVAFGAAADIMMELVFFSYFIDTPISKWLYVLLLPVIMLLVCLLLYPVFLCINTRYCFLGSIIGFLYSSTWYILYSIVTLDCKSVLLVEFLTGCLSSPAATNSSDYNEPMEFYDAITQQFPYVRFVADIPTLISYAALILGFLHSFVICILKRNFWEISKDKKLAEKFQMDYVRALLQPPDRDNISEKPNFFKAKLLKLRTNHLSPSFRYSTKMFVTFYLCFIISYKVIFYYVSLLLNLETVAKETIDGFVRLADNGTTSDIGQYYQGIVSEFMAIMIGCTAIGQFLTWLNLFHLMWIYKTHLMRLSKGDRSFLPAKRHLESSMSTLASCMRYPGYQVAYVIWGFVIFQLSTGSLINLIYFVIIRPIIKGNPEFVLKFLRITIAPLVISILLYYSVTLAARFLLAEPKQLAIKHRLLYNIVSFYVMFFNVNIGILSCGWRLICSLFIGIAFCCRLHRSVFMRGMEQRDTGYYSYVGMILVDHTHTNPILRTFCSILISETASSNNGETVSRARKMWHLCRTLVLNRELVKLRKRQQRNLATALETHVADSMDDLSFTGSTDRLLEQDFLGYGTTSDGFDC